MYGEGISFIGDIIDLAVEGEIIKKTGAWYAYKDEKIGQGRENAKTYLAENQDVLDQVVNDVKIFVGLSENEGEAAA